MSTSNAEGRVDRLMTLASEALHAGRYPNAETTALEALHAAAAGGMHERMSRILLPLQEARRQRLAFALEAGPIRIVDRQIADAGIAEDGCWVVQPPMVGADARRLRSDAIAAGLSVALLCREPLTKDGRCPVVAVGTTIVRTRVAAPLEGTDRPPSRAWFAAALEALGDEAIEGVDPDMKPVKRVVALLDRLDTVVDHEKLHQALADACRVAAANPSPILPEPCADDTDLPLEE